MNRTVSGILAVLALMLYATLHNRWWRSRPDTGGFLGIGALDVIVRHDQVKLKNDRFVKNMTEAELKALPAWQD